VPEPTLGHGFATLIRFFAEDLRQPLSAAPKRELLTDMDRVRRGLEPPLPAPPIRRSELFHALSESVHGQEQALRAVSGEIASHLAKADPGRPAVLLAVGPTGVGKTRTAEAIAPALNTFRSDAEPVWKTVRINMSEYKEPHRVSQLLGAPAGYVGYGEKSQLVQALSESPRCVLIFDEIEKAHEDFFEILMAAMDEGVFTLPQARDAAAKGQVPNAGKGGKKASLPSHQLSCKESIIVLTSNLDQAGMVAEHEAGNDPLAVETALRERLIDAGIKPEIVNRLGRCVVFLPIPETDRAEIVLTTVVEAAREYGLEVKHVCPELVLEVLRRSPTQTFGARAERRTVSWLMGEAFVQAVCDGLREVRLLSNPTRCEAWAPAHA
jgi:ATP-dependent Clp protease ATP-binding subunit ClpC